MNLQVLDSTDPGAVLNFVKNLDPQKTLYIVSTKSGGTIETLSFFKYFFTYCQNKLGKDQASKHFAAITDPGSGLEKMAKELNLRKIFINNPNIGGRYSVLSFFGSQFLYVSSHSCGKPHFDSGFVIRRCFICLAP